MMDQIRDNEFKDTGKVEVSNLLEQLGRFDENPSSFLVNLLATQCFLGKADAGAILCSNREQHIDVLAVYPQFEKRNAPPLWLTESAQLIQKHPDKTAVVKPFEQSSVEGRGPPIVILL